MEEAIIVIMDLNVDLGQVGDARFDCYTPNSTKPFYLLDGTMLTAVLVPD